MAILNRNKNQPKKDLTREVGVAGEVLFTGFDREESRADNVSIKDYRKMIDRDPTVESLFNIMTLPIVSATYRIDADENDEGEVQADFVRKNLLEPPHKGGMETPFTLFQDQLMMAIVDGFALWEKVYKLQNGKYVYKKLAYRDSIGITLLRDKDGGYGGARQVVSYAGETVDVTLPAYKTFLFTHNKARDYLYGRSALKSLVKPYNKKAKLEYLDSIALQADAIKPKVLIRTEAGTYESDDPNSKSNTIVNKALKALAKLGERNPVASLPFGFDVKEITQKGRDPHQSIERQNSEMARAFLATFTLLGSQGGSNVGSFALSDNLSDMLMISLKALMAKIEEHINQYVIADLHDLNFATPHYSELHYDDLTSDTVQVIADAFMKLLEKDRVSDEMVQGIEEQTASRLEIDLEQIKKDREARAADEAKKAEAQKPTPSDDNPDGGTPTGGSGGGNSQDGGSAGNGGKFLSDNQWWRPLTPYEQSVKFADINAKMDTLESSYAKAAEPILADFARKLVESGVATQKIKDVKVELPKEYASLLATTIRTAYNYAKTGAADELNLPAPATSPEAVAGMKEMVEFVLSKQQDDIRGIIADERLKHQTNLSSEDDAAKLVSDALLLAIMAWVTEIVKPTASAIVGRAINNGRNDVFVSVQTSDDLYQYSSLLDFKVCPICKSLDGSVVTPEDYARTEWKPPLHFNCRCLWILIRKLSPDYKMPEVTGIDDDHIHNIDRMMHTKKQDLINEGSLRPDEFKKTMLNRVSGKDYTGSTLADFENAVRGNNFETGAVVGSDGKVVASFVGESHSVAIPRDIATGQTVTHNHPSGGAFSLADIKVAADYNLKEIRAFGDVYSYSMKPGASGWPSASAIIKARSEAEAQAKANAKAKVREVQPTKRQLHAEITNDLTAIMAEKLGMIYTRTKI